MGEAQAKDQEAKQRPDAGRTLTDRTLTGILSDIQFEQSLFSLPFALLSMLVAADGFPTWTTLGLIVLAVISARAAAMAVNRVADAAFDARNPRTARRAIPAGRVSALAMTVFAVLSTCVFVAAAAALNPLCLALAPVALVFLIGYSWMKRLTPLCHLILGATIGIAPLGAWAAVQGTYLLPSGGVAWTPWLIAVGVATWVAGFDVLYACPDAEVDAREGLRSIPSAIGVERAFHVASALHVATVTALGGAALVDPRLAGVFAGALAIGSVLLVIEHRVIAPGRYERMATAFFRLNALFGLLLLAGGAIDVLSAT